MEEFIQNIKNTVKRIQEIEMVSVKNNKDISDTSRE